MCLWLIDVRASVCACARTNVDCGSYADGVPIRCVIIGQVNIAPSFNTDAPLDRTVKTNVSDYINERVTNLVKRK